MSRFTGALWDVFQERPTRQFSRIRRRLSRGALRRQRVPVNSPSRRPQ